MTESIKYPDAQQLTVHGRVANLEEVEYNDQNFLSVKVYTNLSDEITACVHFTNSNGLLTACNGNLQTGQELTLMGRIKAIRAFYMKDDELKPLKKPELQMTVQQYLWLKPQPKADKPFSKELYA